MKIYIDNEIKGTMQAMSETQVSTKRRELADLYMQSKLLDDKTKLFGYEDYSTLHGTVTEILKTLYELPPHELMFFTWRYEPITPSEVGGLGVRFTLFHNHRSTEDINSQLLTITVQRRENDINSNKKEDLDIEGFFNNDNAGEDAPSLHVEHVVGRMASYLEEIRQDNDKAGIGLPSHGESPLLIFQLEFAWAFVHVNFEVLDEYDEYCRFLGRDFA